MDFQRIPVNDADLPGQFARIGAAARQEQHQTDHPFFEHIPVPSPGAQTVVARESFIFYARLARLPTGRL